MNLNEFIEDKQVKIERVAKLNEQVVNDKEKLKDVEQAYNKALVEGNDKEADKLFPKFSQLKNSIESNAFKASKLKGLNDTAIKNNAEKTIFHLKEIYADYQEKAKLIDDEMLPIEQKANELHHRARELQEEFKDIKTDYLALLDHYELKSTPFFNSGVPSHSSSLQVFNRSSLLPTNFGILRQASNVKTSSELRNERRNELPENATIAEIAQANRIIGGN